MFCSATRSALTTIALSRAPPPSKTTPLRSTPRIVIPASRRDRHLAAVGAAVEQHEIAGLRRVDAGLDGGLVLRNADRLRSEREGDEELEHHTTMDTARPRMEPAAPSRAARRSRACESAAAPGADERGPCRTAG